MSDKTNNLNDSESKGRVDVEHEGEPAKDLEFVDASSKALHAYVQDKQLSFQEVVSKYDIVQAVHDPAHGSYMIVQERSGDSADEDVRLADPVLRDGIGRSEMGYSSPSPFLSWTRTEWNSKLQGQLGIREYYRMRRSDGTIRSSSRHAKTPILAAHWFMEPASDSTRDKNAAEFVWDNFQKRLNVSWKRLLDDVLLMLDYGYMAFEKVWNEPYGPHDRVRDGRLRYQKLSPRHPLDIDSWEYDLEGGPDRVWMLPNPNTSVLDISTADAFKPIPIPIDKLAVFTFDCEAGDLNGIPILRSAWKHYYYKDTMYKIDAIQKERHGIGVPIIKMPPGWSGKDLALAENMGRNLRTNERSHIVLPPLWEVMFAKLEGQPVDCLRSIEHHDKKIMSNAMAPWQDEVTKPDEHTLFMQTSRFIADLVCDVFDQYIIPDIIEKNFSRVGHPKLKARRIGEWEELRTLSFATRNFVGAGLIRPDDRLESTLRAEMDMPPIDFATVRDVIGGFNEEADEEGTGATSKAGMPRQKKNPPVSPGRSNTGTDRSGG